MPGPVFHQIQLAGQTEFINLNLERLPADPPLLVDGRVWYNTQLKAIRYSQYNANGELSVVTLSGAPEVPEYELPARLEALASFSTPGLLVQTSTGWTARRITSSDDSLDVSNPTGVDGNIDIRLGPIGTPSSAATFRKFAIDDRGRVALVSPVSAADILDLLNGDQTFVRSAGLDAPLDANNQEIFNLPYTPPRSSSAVSREYVHDLLQGLVWKTPVVAASTTGTNVTLSGLPILDGYQTVAGDRVLIKNNTDATQNGIYVVAAGAWSRAEDANNSLELDRLTVLVQGGSTQSGSIWTQTLEVSSVPSATAYVQINTIPAPPPPLQVGTGLQVNSNVASLRIRPSAGLFTTLDGSTESTASNAALAVRLVGSSLQATASGLSVAPGGIGTQELATITSPVSQELCAISVDEKGRVTEATPILPQELRDFLLVRSYKVELGATTPAASYVVTHSLDTLDLNLTVWVFDPTDSRWKNDLVSVELLDSNSLRIDLAAPRRVRVTLISL